jgi:hypothetical protein
MSGKEITRGLHYTVEGEPGTWSTHQELDSAIEQAQKLGVSLVHSVDYVTVERGANRGHSGVRRRLAWAAPDCSDCLLPGA